MDELYQVRFKLIILGPIGAKEYQKLIFEILLLYPLWGTVPCVVCRNFQIAHSCEMKTRFIKIYELINNGEKLRVGACP